MEYRIFVYDINGLFLQVGCVIIFENVAYIHIRIYLFRDWHHLQLAFAIGSLSLVSYFFFIPESPRWLVSKNRIQEAQELLWLLAKKNGVDAKRTRLAEYFDTLKCLKESQETNSHNGSSTMVLAKNAITNSEYLKRTFLLIPPFFAVGVA